ncbi:MAG: transposase, partial [Eubacterium sp.]|nr:transposase [Eubacterium sp.]
SACGAIKKELRLDERIYICGCGNCMDRDVNAALNIREEGRRLLEAA